VRRVLDASALLAYLRRETGWELVAQLLADSAIECYAHAINLCEVYYGFCRREGRPAALTAIRDLYTAGVLAREDLDEAFWRDIGDMIATGRGGGRTIPLGDACGMALARRLACDFVAADHNLDPLLPLGFCRVVFIR
jgi:PIN domain nuclease of toxin-antitoxin system